jgi:hypothetical protein
VIRLSATTGEGLDAWYDWIDRRRNALATVRDSLARFERA